MQVIANNETRGEDLIDKKGRYMKAFGGGKEREK